MKAIRAGSSTFLALLALAAGAWLAWPPRAAADDEAEDDSKVVPAELKKLKYRLVGPAAGGRVCRAVGVPGDPRTFYAATAAGGVWKSTDGGVRWKPVFD